MAKVSINLNEKFPSEEEEYVDASAGALAPVDPSSAAEGKEQINGSADPPVSNADAGAPSKEVEEPKTAVAKMGGQAAGSSAPVDDIQRKIRRAERFGVPVQLSEQEKRNSRAERFGTGFGMMKSEGLTKSEELKRKARAERFGVSVSSTSVDEEAKKKARLERFNSNPKTASDEEDKRKARAIRFSTLLPQVNSKTAVAGGATGGA